MTSRIVRAVIDDDCPALSQHTSALSHFRQVIADAWTHPSPETALAKLRLNYFCGHIDPIPGLRDYIPVEVVASHYTGLHPVAAGDNGTVFVTALTAYVSLLHADIRDGTAGVEFRGASVALTFDRGRHETNMLRFVGEAQNRSPQMRRELPRNMADKPLTTPSS